MKAVVYNTLPDDAVMIRSRVFKEEQGFKNEFDDIDNTALHIVMYDDNDVPAAVCRIFKGSSDGEYILGRLAVIKEYRGTGVGAKTVSAAERKAVENGGKYITLLAQLQAKDFYKRLGYAEYGDIEYDEDCPHIKMSKSLI